MKIIKGRVDRRDYTCYIRSILPPPTHTQWPSDSIWVAVSTVTRIFTSRRECHSVSTNHRRVHRHSGVVISCYDSAIYTCRGSASVNIIYIYIYIYTKWPCHASLWNSVVAWMRNISVPENSGFDTNICDYFYRSLFPTTHLYGC